MLDVSAYPVGNITLVFTDIENSSSMTSELERTRIGTYERELRDPHRNLLLKLAAKHNGHEIHRAGDGHLLVFQFADDALTCVVAFQQALHANPIEYTEDGKTYKVKVRIGVHTTVDQRKPTLMENGLPEYPGSDTNYAARVGGYSPGGHIIVSQATYNHARKLSGYEQPPCAVHLLPGCLLKSFPGPHDLYEILYFADQKPFAAGSRWLPEWYQGESDCYIPRPQLQQTVMDYLTKSRLVTLLADGGMGKTRLAIACALEIAGRYEDGVYFVDLSELSSCTREAMAEAIGKIMTLNGAEVQPDTLLTSLRHSKSLLILDNYESAQSEEVRCFLGDLIFKTNALRLLVTGRTTVGLSDRERIVSMDAGMERQQAREMFVAYARRTSRGEEWIPTLDDETNIQRIVTLTEGIPLAIELAAGWSGNRTIQKIADGLQETPLGQMSGVPVKAGRAMPSKRHDSLTRSLDWSFSLLAEEAQRFFAVLSLFADSFTEEAVDVVSNKHADKNEGLLDALYDVSLLQYAEVDGIQRYRFHRFTRAYAAEKLANPPPAAASFPTPRESSDMKKRLAKYYLTLAETTAPLIKKTEPANKKKVDRLEADLQNLSAALEWCVSKNVPLGLRVAAELWNFWWMRGYANMGIERIEALLKKADKSLPEWAEAASVAGHLSRHIGEFPRAQELYDESLEAFQAHGDSSGAARVLRHLGVLAWHQRQWEDAEEHLNNAYQTSKTDKDKAESLYELGNLARSQQNYEQAAQHIRASLTFFRGADETRAIATALLALGNIDCRLNNLDEARREYAESLELFSEIKDKGRLALIFERIAAFAHQDSPNQSAVLIGAADKIRKGIGSPLPKPDRAEYYDKLIADLKQAIGTEAAYEAQHEQGFAMSLADAIKIADEEVKPRH